MKSFFVEMQAALFNRRARKNAPQVLESLGIKRGDVVGDIGSGGGYYTIEFAERVGPTGRVFAVDTNEKLLESVSRRVRGKGIGNVVPVPGDESGKTLPVESCDLLFLRNVFHHISDPVPFFRNMKSSLKRGGRVAILEWRPRGGRSLIGLAGHCTEESRICEVMTEAGFSRLKRFSFLPAQSFNLFLS